MIADGSLLSKTRYAVITHTLQPSVFAVARVRHKKNVPFSYVWEIRYPDGITLRAAELHESVILESKKAAERRLAMAVLAGLVRVKT